MEDDVGDVRAGGIIPRALAGLRMAGHEGAFRQPLLAKSSFAPYPEPMNFLSRMSPIRAFQDLRFFLQGRQPYELIFFALSVVITGSVIFAFYSDSRVAPEYKRNIVYVEQWAATRTDAEIRAQQAIDAPKKAKLLAEQEEANRKRREGFKRLDEQMSRWGF